MLQPCIAIDTIGINVRESKVHKCQAYLSRAVVLFIVLKVQIL